MEPPWSVPMDASMPSYQSAAAAPLGGAAGRPRRIERAERGPVVARVAAAREGEVDPCP